MSSVLRFLCCPFCFCCFKKQSVNFLSHEDVVHTFRFKSGGQAGGVSSLSCFQACVKSGCKPNSWVVSYCTAEKLLMIIATLLCSLVVTCRNAAQVHETNSPSPTLGCETGSSTFSLFLFHLQMWSWDSFFIHLTDICLCNCISHVKNFNW